MSDAEKPIIIIKKKGGHGGHHGGAWKVAYADFVTAMMAFFMVMWLLNSAEHQTRQAIASYFRKPGWFDQNAGTPFGADGTGILPEAFGPPSSAEVGPQGKWDVRRKLATVADQVELSTRKRKDQKGLSSTPAPNNDPNGISVSALPEETGYKVALSRPNPIKPQDDGSDEHHYVHSNPGGLGPNSGPDEGPEQEAARDVFNQIKQEISLHPELREVLGDVEVRMDPEGITLEVMDTEKASMFATGSTKILPKAETAFSGIVNLLRPLSNPIEVIGHTDATPFSSFPNAMSNWDLSALRANEARKVLQSNGFPGDRVLAVIGKADKDLRFPDKPFAAGNRRITVRLKFTDGKTSAPVATDELLQQALTPPPTPTRPPPSPTPIPTAVPTIAPAKAIPTRASRGILKTTTRTSFSHNANAIDPFPVIKPGQLAEEQAEKGG